MNWSEKIELSSINDPKVIELLCNEGISHVYIGQKQGQVSFGNQPIFTEKELLSSPYFDTIYQQDRVSIYRIKPMACNK